MVDGGALGLVGGLTIDLEETLNLIQKGLLGSVVRSTELLRTLEHQVLEVVRQTGGLGGVVLTAHLHGNGGLKTRGLLVYTHVDLQAVVQSVDAGLHGVARNGFVLVFATSRGQHRNDESRN